MASYDNRAAIFSRVLAVLLLMFVMSGCAGKQNALNPSDFGKMDASELTARERAILAQNPGKIAASVPEYARPLVEAQASFYLHRGRKTMTINSQRAGKYLAYTREVFRSRGMPEELAYLAIVESGYVPTAVSGAGAAGAWQFMSYTGIKYGLAQDKYGDERLDIYSATIAAADYLQKLYNQFGDWPTAIAAYNAGEGKMARACKAAGETTFFGVLRKNGKLDEQTRLKDETCQYVPRFLAITAIMENLDSLGFTPLNPADALEVTKVRLKPNTDLKAMASACGLSWNEFKTHNPHFKQTISHKKHVTSAYVPSHAGTKAIVFASNPVSASRSVQAANGKSTRPSGKQAASGGTVRYTMRPGDTLYKVARQHKTTVADLMAANGLADANAIRVGHVLAIPDSKKSASQKTGQKGVKTVAYSVQPKDNLYKISRKLNVSVDDLKRWNKLTSENVRVGQSLVVLR